MQDVPIVRQVLKHVKEPNHIKFGAEWRVVRVANDQVARGAPSRKFQCLTKTVHPRDLAISATLLQNLQDRSGAASDFEHAEAVGK